MKQICMIRMDEGSVGVLTDMGDYHVIVAEDAVPDLPIMTLTHRMGVPVDPRLDRLSSMPYIIVNDDTIIHGDRVFGTSMTIPEMYRWSALPIVHRENLVEYEPTELDYPFINDGYVSEIRDAKYIIIAPESDSINTIDLLIREVGDDGYESFSGRTIHVDKIDRIDGRYIHTSSIPMATGLTDIDIPYTYTKDSLHGRFIMLQDRLQDYGTERVASAVTALESMRPLLESRENQYKAASVYDEVHELVNRVKGM